MKNKPIWHYKSPDKEEYIQAIKELNNSQINDQARYLADQKIEVLRSIN